MSPIKHQMLRTFNASSLGFKESGRMGGGKSRMRSSVPTLALPKSNVSAPSPDDRHSSTVTPMNKVSKQQLKAKNNYNAWLVQPTATTMTELTESKLQAREREQDELIEPSLAKIEGKLAQTCVKKQEHIRDKKMRLRTSLDIKASRTENWKQFEQEQLEERRRRLDAIKKERVKRIKHELDEQTDNYFDYKWRQESKQAQFQKRKEYRQMQDEEKHKALEEKVSLQEANLDYHRDMQKKNQLIK